MEFFATVLILLASALLLYVGMLEFEAHLIRRKLKKSKSQLKNYADNNKNPNEE